MRTILVVTIFPNQHMICLSRPRPIKYVMPSYTLKADHSTVHITNIHQYVMIHLQKITFSHDMHFSSSIAIVSNAMID